MGSSDKFALFIHHGGRFEEILYADCYIGGNYVIRADLDSDCFGYFDVKDLVEKIGFVSWKKMWYQIPQSNSFRVIRSDKEVMDMLAFLSMKIRTLHIYVEGGKRELDGAEEKNVATSDGGLYNVNLGTNDEAVYDNYVEEGVWGCGKVAVTDFNDEEGRDSDGEERHSDGEVRDSDQDVGNNKVSGGSSEEDSDYDPPQNESSDDSLDVDDLGSGNEEYIESRQNAATVRGKMLNLFDMHIGNGGENLSEYELSYGDINSSETDEDAEIVLPRRKRNMYDPRCNHKDLKIELGLRFQDGYECRNALTNWAIENGKFIQFRRVSKTQLKAKCKPPYPWRVYASVVQGDQTFIIKSYGGEHICPRDMNNKLVTSKWVAKRYLNVFRIRPNLTIKELNADILERFSTNVPKDRLYKARHIATELVRGSVENHYALIRPYIAELRRVDSEGRFELLLGDGHVFKGLYIGHSALIKGFKLGCRPVIGLDGCFLKTYLGGILMCAVGKDGNNRMFPIAWAVVEIENEECWTWFLKCLCYDLGITNGAGWTFISDQQKGLENAVSNLAPAAEHRNCARHVYMNWKKQHSGQTLKNIFWRAVKSTYKEEYKMALEEMKAESVSAFQDFIARDVSKFCKAFLSVNTCSDMIDNNLSETFNDFILNARGKHVIHMLEEIRTSLMVRQVQKVAELAKVSDRICPNIRKKLEHLRISSRNCVAYPALGEKFEIHNEGDRFVIDMKSRSCTCRVWQLTGIPCIHAICAIQFMHEDASNYVNDYYTVRRVLEAYRFGLEPLNGEKMWPEVEGFKVLLPPTRKMPGRPKKKRKRALEEKDPKNPNRLKRFSPSMTCQNCQQHGHNARGCKNPTVPIPATEKRKRGRPSKDKGPVEASSKSNQTSQNTICARERNFCRKGAGVYISQGTGNIYYHMPAQRRVTQVKRTQQNMNCASSSNVQKSCALEGPLTQESRAPDAPNGN